MGAIIINYKILSRVEQINKMTFRLFFESTGITSNIKIQ